MGGYLSSRERFQTQLSSGRTLWVSGAFQSSQWTCSSLRSQLDQSLGRIAQSSSHPFGSPRHWPEKPWTTYHSNHRKRNLFPARHWYNFFFFQHLFKNCPVYKPIRDGKRWRRDSTLVQIVFQSKIRKFKSDYIQSNHNTKFGVQLRKCKNVENIAKLGTSWLD